MYLATRVSLIRFTVLNFSKSYSVWQAATLLANLLANYHAKAWSSLVKDEQLDRPNSQPCME